MKAFLIKDYDYYNLFNENAKEELRLPKVITEPFLKKKQNFVLSSFIEYSISPHNCT